MRPNLIRENQIGPNQIDQTMFKNILRGKQCVYVCLAVFFANGYWSAIFYIQYPGGTCAAPPLVVHESKLESQPGFWFEK